MEKGDAPGGEWDGDKGDKGMGKWDWGQGNRDGDREVGWGTRKWGWGKGLGAREMGMGTVRWEWGEGYGDWDGDRDKGPIPSSIPPIPNTNSRTPQRTGQMG